MKRPLFPYLRIHSKSVSQNIQAPQKADRLPNRSLEGGRLVMIWAKNLRLLLSAPCGESSDACTHSQHEAGLGDRSEGSDLSDAAIDHVAD